MRKPPRSRSEPGATRLLLLGAGHVNLDVLRRTIVGRPPELQVTIVSLGPRHFYSGMTPGYLAGQYGFDDLTSDVPGIARRAGAECLLGEVAALDPDARRVRLADGREVEYDLVSLNLGSLLAGAGSDAARHAEIIKPLERAARVKERIEALVAEGGGEPARVVVVGAGASGVEVAFAARAALRRGGRACAVTVLDSGDRILRGYSDPFRRRAEAALAELGIRVELGRRVERVTPNAVRCSDGRELPSDLTIWLTGPAASPLLAASGLPVDGRGFLLIDDRLRSVADPRVFAVGDCGTLEPYPETPKAGVYAVREAPILWANLLATVRGEPLTRYTPQSGFLSILNTCDGRALLRYKGFISWSRWAWCLKDRIDRSFMGKYQRLVA